MGAHYSRFKLTPLDTARVSIPTASDSIPTASDAKQLWNRMGPHIVAEAETIGTYLAADIRFEASCD